MVKRVFFIPLRALKGFIDSIIRLTHVPLSCPHYTSISRRAKQVEVSFKTKTRGAIQYLASDATSPKVYGEGEWKVKTYAEVSLRCLVMALTTRERVMLLLRLREPLRLFPKIRGSLQGAWLPSKPRCGLSEVIRLK